VCPECRYEIALVHDRQWVEVLCPGCGASIAGDAFVTVVDQQRPATDEDLKRWIHSVRSKRDRKER
jgi:ribosomal protein L37AE/L43A